MTLDFDPDLDLRIDRVIHARTPARLAGLDRPARLRPLVAPGSDAVSGRASRRDARRRVRDVDERGRRRLRTSPRRVLRRRRARRADRVHEHARQPPAADQSRAPFDHRRHQLRRSSPGHRLPRRRETPRRGLAARTTKRSDSSTAGVRSPRSSPPSPRVRRHAGGDHPDAVRHARWRLSGTGRARRGHDRRLHARWVDGPAHGPDIHHHRRRVARPRARSSSDAAPTRPFTFGSTRTPTPTIRSLAHELATPSTFASHTITGTPWTPATILLGGDVDRRRRRPTRGPRRRDELQLHGSASGSPSRSSPRASSTRSGSWSAPAVLGAGPPPLPRPLDPAHGLRVAEQHRHAGRPHDPRVRDDGSRRLRHVRRSQLGRRLKQASATRCRSTPGTWSPRRPRC